MVIFPIVLSKRKVETPHMKPSALVWWWPRGKYICLGFQSTNLVDGGSRFKDLHFSSQENNHVTGIIPSLGKNPDSPLVAIRVGVSLSFSV